METPTITLTPDTCTNLLQSLQEQAEGQAFLKYAYGKFDKYRAQRAERKLREAEALIFLVQKELHNGVYEG